MLRYAAQNYVKDRGYDNSMTKFFNGIVDFDKMAKILNKYSIGITPTVLMLNDKKE